MVDGDERVRRRAGVHRARPSRRRNERPWPALHSIVSLRRGRARGPFNAYEWNKMKTPTRILVGGPEVTSAFVLMGLALARRAMMGRAVFVAEPYSGAMQRITLHCIRVFVSVVIALS